MTNAASHSHPVRHDLAGQTAHYTDPAASGTGVLIDPAAFAAADDVITVAPGQTYTLGLTFAAGNTLLVEGGTGATPQSALAAVYGNTTNYGTIDIYGGVTIPTQKYSRIGGVLLVKGSMTNDAQISVFGGPANYTSAPGGNIQVLGKLTNNGTITTTGGTLGSQHSGGSGILQVDQGASFTNTGLVDAVGATGVVGGRFRAQGTIINSGTVRAEGGVLINGGPTPGEIGPSGVVNFGKSTVDNSGTFDLAGGQSSTAGLGLGSFMFIARYCQVENTGLIKTEGATSAANSVAGSITGGRVVEYGTLSNDGTILSTAGETAIGSAGTAGGGVFFLSHGVMQNNALIAIDGTPAAAGILPSALSAGQFADDGVLINDAQISVSGGNSLYYGATGGFGGLLNVAGPNGIYGFGHLDNYGTITADGGYRSSSKVGASSGGTIQITGGILQNAAYIDLRAGYAGTGTSIVGGGASMLVQSGSMVNAGTIMVAGEAGPGLAGARIVDYAGVTNNGLIELGGVAGANGAGAITITSTGTLADPGTISGVGTITNNGILLSGVTAGKYGVIATAALINNGTVKIAVKDGFTVSAKVSASGGATGAFNIAATSSLTFDAAVASSQTVNFTAAHAVLGLGDAADFSGVLSGLQANDTIDFLKLDVTSATATGTTLAIGLSTGGTIDLALAAPLPSGLATQLVSDGQGGTDVNFVKSATFQESLFQAPATGS